MGQFDCAIVGAGMVGSAMAIALADLGLKVVVIDKYQPQAITDEQAFDLRVSAISIASEQLLKQLGAWQYLHFSRICPYKRLGVWETELSYTEFNADDINKPYLGHILENRLLQLALWEAVEKHHNITLLCPEQLQSFTEGEVVVLQLSEQQISAKLLIAADGANSQVRQLAGIGITGWDYGQSAMLINVSTELAQQDITWQQFFPTGPLAMLPMLGNNASLVWYHQKAEIKRLAQLSNQQLTQEIAIHFPKRLGKVTVLDKASFALTRRHANQYVKGKVVLLGDAAHTINPLAGQGVNLGFKDVKALQMVIANAIGENHDWASQTVLAEYEKLRRQDNLLMMTTMDGLYASFSHPSPLLKFVRNAGLSVVNKLPKVKNKALAYACGI